MLGVVQPPTSSDLFRSLQYSGSFRMNSTLWRFVPLLLLLGWVDFHVYRFQCKRREQVSTSQAKKQREFVEQAKAAGLRSTWNWHDLRISPESPDLLADNQGGWYYYSDGIAGHVWGKLHSLKTCQKARRGNNLQAQTSRLCRTSKKKAPKVKRKVWATAGCCSPSLLSAEGWKVWLLMMTMRMTMRMIIIAMRMKMKGEHDCSFDHRLTSIWLTLFHAGRRRRKESADQWSPQKKMWVISWSPRNQFRFQIDQPHLIFSQVWQHWMISWVGPQSGLWNLPWHEDLDGFSISTYFISSEQNVEHTADWKAKDTKRLLPLELHPMLQYLALPTFFWQTFSRQRQKTEVSWQTRNCHYYLHAKTNNNWIWCFD